MAFDFTTLLETARDPSLDDEARMLAVMSITAQVYRQKARVLDNAESRTRTAQPQQPRQHVVTHQGKRNGVPTMRDFLIEQLQVIDRHDNDGRAWGLRYDEIERRLLERFPVVTTPGKYFGLPPSNLRKNLHELASDLRREGITLPGRPRANGPRSRRPLSPEHRLAIKRGHQRRSTGRAVAAHGTQEDSSVRGRMLAAEPTDRFSTHTCAQCGAGFRPASVDSGRGVRRQPIYCGGACKMAAHRQRQAAIDLFCREQGLTRLDRIG